MIRNLEKIQRSETKNKLNKIRKNVISFTHRISDFKLLNSKENTVLPKTVEKKKR